MNLILYRNCFLVGMTAATAVGPIFILVFNRGALYGFKKGFATALGASIGDGLLFGLSFVGVLRFLETSKKIVIVMDFVVSFLLIFIGMNMLTKKHDISTGQLECREPNFITSAKSFLLTVINPINIFFFMFISVKVLPASTKLIPVVDSLLASVMISLGSLTTFSTVAFVAKSLRKTLKQEQLFVATRITGVAFILLGFYFSVEFVKQILRYFGIL